MSTDQLQIITDSLNLPPFERRVTLINTSEALADPIKAIQLLADVAHHVRPHPLAEDSRQQTPPVKVTASNMEQVATSITDFAICLLDSNEARSMADKQAFVQELILPNSSNMRRLLCAILKDLQAAREVVYVSKFKLPPALPADYMADQQVQILLSQLREAQSRFTEAFNTNRDMQKDQLSQRMERLATDKTMLLTRRDKLFDRVKQAKALAVPKEATSLASRRRIALLEIEELKTQINSQNEIRRAALNSAKAVVNSARGTPANIMEASEVENKRLKQEIINLTCEIGEKESLAHLIQSEPGPEAIEIMENELETLRIELAKYRELISNAGSAEGDDSQEKISFLNQQFMKIKAQRAQLETRLNNARRESLEIDAEVAKKCSSADIATLMKNIDDVDIIPVLLFKNLLSKGRALKPLHKKAMDEQQLLRKENAIISRTKDVLAMIPNLLPEAPDETAGEPSGLKPVGAGKVSILGSIGGTGLITKNMMEAKAVLAELDTTLQQKKRDLAPRLSELAALKRQCAQLETELEAENQRAKTLEISREGIVYKLRLGTRTLELEIDTLKTQNVVANMKARLLELELERADNVRDFDRLKREVTSENNACKTQIVEARAKQEELKCSLPNKVAQKKMFNGLSAILNFRRRVALERQEDKVAEIQVDKILVTG